jgi:hypothetical protein
VPVFPHRFAEDLRAIDWFGEPFALARFGDGELACIEGRAYSPYGLGMGTETWRSELGVPLRAELQQALAASDEGYYVGVPPICCQGIFSGEATAYVTAPWERRVPATLFSYANHARFHEIAGGLELRKRSVLVAGKGGDLAVPLDAINHSAWLEPLLQELFAVRQPILVAAGPAACVLVHQYWLRAPKRQVIVDVGSVFDEDLFGHGTRMHTVAGGSGPRGMAFHECKLHGREPCHPDCRPSRF